ncbi:hypothetical protein IMZ48_30855, partial [Candidatus Bathyarchaeota archaeon]|nr:hypothetical protein [Candidatus Bathyarchaeota archaeon]
QKREPFPTPPKRKNKEEHGRRPGPPEGPGGGAERRGAGSPREETCYICFNDNHRTHDCCLLTRYTKFGEEAPRLSRAAMERCRTWLRGADSEMEELSETVAPRVYCRVCSKATHSTERCKALGLYRRHGNDTRGMSRAVKNRCEDELRAEDDAHTYF